MASAKGNNSALMQRMSGNNAVSNQQPSSLKGMLADVNVKKRFEELLGKKAAGFMSSLISVTNGNTQLQKADPKTVIAAGAIAAALDLPVDPNLGFAYVVPYNNSKKLSDGSWTKVVQAQFQLGYKGYIQLAMRTGQYKTINACEVYEGEIKNINRFTGEMEFGEKASDAIVGYIAYFKLLNGFEKYLYMTVEEVQKHGQTYSKSFGHENGRWKQDFHAMAIKTVLKRLLSKFGILSIEMQTSFQADQAVVNQDDEGNASFEYVDSTIDVDVETENDETYQEGPKEKGKSEEPEKHHSGPCPGESELEYHRRMTAKLK